MRPCYDGCKELIWMEWLDRMNDALGYLEANLAGTADMEHAARLARMLGLSFRPDVFVYRRGASSRNICAAAG